MPIENLFRGEVASKYQKLLGLRLQNICFKDARQATTYAPGSQGLISVRQKKNRNTQASYN